VKTAPGQNDPGHAVPSTSPSATADSPEQVGPKPEGSSGTRNGNIPDYGGRVY
jgi:hypothetical protein